MSAAPFRIAILSSSSAPGIEQMISDPNRGTLYEIAAVMTTDTDFQQSSMLEDAGVRVVYRPLKRLLGERGASLRSVRAREEYDRETADVLHSLGAQWVILCGYNFIVTEPLINAFRDHILALHEGDLTVLDENSARRYTELHAVRRAIFRGDTETRASLFFVTDRVGEGPLMLLSAPYPVSGIAADAISWGGYDLAASYARVHGEWMRRSAYGEMLVRGMQFLAGGTIKVSREIAWIDGAPGPCRLGDAPRVCRDFSDTIQRGIPSSCPFIQS